MNKDAAFFSSIFVAIIAFLSSIYIYFDYGIEGAFITILGGAAWIGLGYYFRNSKGGYSKRENKNVHSNHKNSSKKKKRR